MTIIKKQGLGTWISLGAILLCIIALAYYGAATIAGNELVIASGSQPFYDFSRPEDSAMASTVVVLSIFAIILTVAAIVGSQFNFEGTLGKACEIAVGAVRIIAPVLLMIALLLFVYGSFTGIGWTFFSNEELEIYPEAVEVGKQVVTGLVFLGISLVASIVASYFALVKKEN